MISTGCIRVQNATAEPGNQRGTATLTAVMILGLLALFAAASLSRVTTEALVMGNDYSNTQAFYASQASLELMSRNFNKIFDTQLRPSQANLDAVEADKPDITGFRFDQSVRQVGNPTQKPIDDGPFSGLISLRTPWRLTSVATYPNGAQTQLNRTFFNHQIPIFQFGIFYNDDMEFHPGPVFNFGGRVHSNGNIFMMSGDNLYFRSRVTAVGEVVRDTSRMGAPASPTWGGNVSVADTSGVFKLVTKGSVIGGPDTTNTDPDMPNGTVNATWSTDSKVFGGNLLAHQRLLRLPLQISSNSDPIELVRRGRATDDAILASSRFCNQPGIRVTLSDSQSRLPGGTGGVRLDGAWDGLGGDSGSQAAPGDGTRGYVPKAMTDYQAKRFNGDRQYTGASYTDGGMPAQRQTWIKVEVVTINPTTLAIQTVDATADFLSLGLTHQDANGLNIGDSRAILKMQRYEIIGPPIKVPAGNVNGGSNTDATAAFTSYADPREDAGSLPVYTYESSATAFSFVATSRRDTSTSPAKWKATNTAKSAAEATAHDATDSTAATAFEQTVTVGGVTYRVVPFPIEMYSSREGLYNEDLAAGSSGSPGTSGSPSWWYLYTGTSAGTSLGTTSKIPVAGNISLVDIDMNNLGVFLRGDWNGRFPNNAALPDGSLSSDDVSDNGGAGWIIYVSDRRGDRDDDGEYDMEDVYGPGDGILQAGEDVNHNATLQTDYTWEADRYTAATETDVAALIDHKYFRRAVRLINGQTLIGTVNQGYTIASENAVYVLGNYNATGVAAKAQPTPPDQYNGAEVPCSIVADAVTLLSNNWNDAKSFRNPCEYGTRTATETTYRAAFLIGDTLSSMRVAPNQGGGDANLAGGVHNFPRFLENWGGVYANYSGSLINLFNSRQHNGPHKSGGRTYSPPIRNWVFDTTFLDPNKLPPGTPFFQYVQMTGFRQTIRQVT